MIRGATGSSSLEEGDGLELVRYFDDKRYVLLLQKGYVRLVQAGSKLCVCS